MSNLKPKYKASTKQGKFRFIGMTGANWAAELLNCFPDQDLTITVSKRRKERSNPQNRYYHGVVIPLVAEGFRETGLPLDRSQIHEFLKREFLPPIEIISNLTGEVKKLPATTTALSTSEMMDFFALISQWSAEFLGVQIPEPNEQRQIEFE